MQLGKEIMEKKEIIKQKVKNNMKLFCFENTEDNLLGNYKSNKITYRKYNAKC